MRRIGVTKLDNTSRTEHSNRSMWMIVFDVAISSPKIRKRDYADSVVPPTNQPKSANPDILSFRLSCQDSAPQLAQNGEHGSFVYLEKSNWAALI